MPTYGYECKSCKHTFDFFQSMKDEPLKTCPKCSKELRRLINGGTGIIFKGNGFYVTDKGSSGGGKSGKTKAAAEPKTASESAPCSSCAKSESCPQAANS